MRDMARKRKIVEAQEDLQELAASVVLKLGGDSGRTASVVCMMLEGVNQHDLVRIVAGKWREWTGNEPLGYEGLTK